MALKDLKKISFEDRQLSRLQDNIEEFTSQFNKKVLSGNFLETTQGQSPIEITIGTTTTLVGHGLNRPYVGWHLVDIQGDARVWRDTSFTNDKDKYLPLKASSAVTVKLWVF